MQTGQVPAMKSSQEPSHEIRKNLISVVMPYWRRQRALLVNVENYSRLYDDEDVEMIVVDDGSPEPAVVPAGLPIMVTVLRLPKKFAALNPCVPINKGVAVSRGEFVVLTNPEVIHRDSILDEMRLRLVDMGPKGYIAAACRGRKWWYCHSTLMPEPSSVGRAPCPEGAGLHFCAMLHRSLFDEIGGFTEAYREGQGYEDSDFLWKLDRAGAKFAICDDFVTDHVECPGSSWPDGGAARNKAIFNAAWPSHAAI